MAELKSELKLKYFELDRANMLNEENINMYQKSLTENEKLQKKIEVRSKEYLVIFFSFNEYFFYSYFNIAFEKYMANTGIEEEFHTLVQVVRDIGETIDQVKLSLSHLMPHTVRQ
jgi:hypothetical protein